MPKLQTKLLRWGRRYPWDEWFTMPRFTLVKGEDFACKLINMMRNINVRAAERGLCVEMEILQEEVSFTVNVYKRPDVCLKQVNPYVKKKLGRPKKGDKR